MYLFSFVVWRHDEESSCELPPICILTAWPVEFDSVPGRLHREYLFKVIILLNHLSTNLWQWRKAQLWILLRTYFKANSPLSTWPKNSRQFL